MKLGRFANESESVASGASGSGSNGMGVGGEFEFGKEAEGIKVGDRCEVEAEGGLSKRGCVKFVGLTDFKPGFWVGVEYDEPLGKHDGTVDGIKYFTSKAKHGAFVRPSKVEVGDFPEEDLMDGLDDEM
ncbi:hypothetical protein HDU76_005977 [Blyttiomyces sp. JEL0837]|nr:hypothetical protein HDU76_005977 [Blyttiomyces sp. JEL0837]